MTQEIKFGQVWKNRQSGVHVEIYEVTKGWVTFWRGGDVHGTRRLLRGVRSFLTVRVLRRSRLAARRVA